MLKGTIELQTERGRGTRLTIRLPARLALETAMIVRIDGQAFALPVAQIEYAQPLEAGLEVELAGAESGPAAAHFVTFRDRRIPVIHAREMLAIACTPAPAWPKLLVVRSASGLVGLAVDSIEGTEELVIKSLGTLLAGHPVISGTSLAVSGEVISILNPSGLERWMSEELPPEPAEPAGSGKAAGQRPGFAVLVVDDSISVRRVVVRHLRSDGAGCGRGVRRPGGAGPAAGSSLRARRDRPGDAPARRIRAAGRDATVRTPRADSRDRGEHEGGRGNPAAGSGAGSKGFPCQAGGSDRAGQAVSPLLTPAGG